MDKTSSLSRRRFFTDIIRDAVKLTRDVKQNIDEGRRISEAISSFDELPIASTYPKELFEQEAIRLGIDMDKIGEKEAIRNILSLQMEQEETKL